jgi:hypothetical protein
VGIALERERERRKLAEKNLSEMAKTIYESLEKEGKRNPQKEDNSSNKSLEALKTLYPQKAEGKKTE